MRYRRLRIAGASYFFTVVTYKRRPLFSEAAAVKLLQAAVEGVRAKRPFELEAQVVMPDHLHAIWALPDDDIDYPTRWRLIKEAFTRTYIATHSPPPRDAGRQHRGEQAVWQGRYWEHLIRDDEDFSAHVEYIHLNPVKHGFASAPSDWPHSTFGDWVAQGLYDVAWGSQGPIELPKWAGRE